MRVLWICPQLPDPGQPGSMAPAARQLQSLRDAGIEFDIVDMRGIAMLKYAHKLPRIRSLARRAELVHAHFGYCGWLGWLQPRRPLVISFMGDDLLGTPNEDGSLQSFSRFMVQANRRLSRWADAVIVKSEEMAQVLAPVNADIIPNGVDTNVFRPRDRKHVVEQLGWQTGRKRVLFPGNPQDPRKCVSLAAAAVDVAQQQLGEAIELVPLWGVEPDDVGLYMNACDAMLMTSLIEGSPNVVKEAMACDVPVVSVPVGDVAELLDGVDTCRLTGRDPDELGAALVDILGRSNASSQPIRRSGRDAIVVRGLDLANTAQRIIAVYERVLGSKVASGESDQPDLKCEPRRTRSGVNPESKNGISTTCCSRIEMPAWMPPVL